MPQTQTQPSSHRAPALRRVPAIGFLDADSVKTACHEAEVVLQTAPLCPTCRRVLRQLHDRLGSTLFYDDDPRALITAFDVADRTDCSVKLLAACIVEFGRPRESVSAGH